MLQQKNDRCSSNLRRTDGTETVGLGADQRRPRPDLVDAAGDGDVVFDAVVAVERVERQNVADERLGSAGAAQTLLGFQVGRNFNLNNRYKASIESEGCSFP